MRDATDRVVERTENGVVTARYSFGAVLDTSGAVVERTIALPGGVILTKRAGGDVWSYPNLRGEVVATADASGAKVGPTRHYSPFGESYQVLPDNARDDYDLAWTGQRFTEHAPGLTDTIEMGARLYSPQLGRFLEVDPVEGGSANDYEYAAGDPINSADISGLWSPSGLNSDEIRFCANPFNWGKCQTAYNEFGRWSIDLTSRFHGGVRNAMRHCIWSCLLHWKWSAGTAGGFLRRHEPNGIGANDALRDAAADIHNNHVGAKLAYLLRMVGVNHPLGALRAAGFVCTLALRKGLLDIGSPYS